MTHPTLFKTIEECNLEFIGNVDDDWMPVKSARASFGKQDKTGEDVKADTRLMKYLAKNKHLSCFEHQHATFLVEVPIFIARQIQRHRTFSYNEISRRYTAEDLKFWVPIVVRAQSTDNKQASSGELVYTSDTWECVARESLNYYNWLLADGVSREQARAVLPQSLLTQFYMTGNLRNWHHFLTLRLHEHAQEEIRVVAKRIEDTLLQHYPLSYKALKENL